MKTLLILYLIYLSWGTVGQGRVSFLEMARYLRKSKSGVKNDLMYLASEGLVEIITMISDAGAKKYFVQLSPKGDEYLMQNFDAAILKYREHVAMILSEVKEQSKLSPHEPRKMSRKEAKAIASGQQKLEGFE